MDIGTSANSAMSLRLDAIAGGDRAAALSLLVELTPRIRNLVRFLVRGDDLVDDLSQEALIAVYLGLPKYAPVGSFTSWVDRVAVHSVFDGLRRVRRHGRTASVEAAELLPASCEEKVAERYFLRRELARLLDLLPDEQRLAYVLHHALGMTVPEVASKLAVPEETLRSRLRLARDRLRAAAQDMEDS